MDNTQKIQSSIDSNQSIELSRGEYIINGKLVLQANQSLHLRHGAWLRRDNNNSDPIVLLSGNYSALTGEGMDCGVVTNNPSEDGVVRVGPKIYDRPANINFWKVSNLSIVGRNNTDDKDVLLSLINSAVLEVGGGSTYNGHVSNCLFRQGGIAIHAGPLTNGNQYSHLLFYKIKNICFYGEQITNNVLQGCFIHHSHGVTVIRLRNRSGYNHFYGVMCDPGPNSSDGRLARFVDISEDCFQNVVIGQGNTGHRFINESKSSLIITHGKLLQGELATLGK